MNTKKTLAVLLCAALALTLAACGAKTDSEPLPTATPEVTATPEPTAEPTEEVTIHDFDIYVDAFKDEYDIEITSTDDGTDIADTDALYAYLYNNGVTRQAVQADLDEGCDSPYIDGYLTYLDDLDKPSEDAIQPVSKSVDLSNATVHSGSEFGMVADVYEVDGKYYIEDGHEVKYDTKYNEWYVDMTDDFAGVQVDKTSEEIAADNKKAEEDTQRAKDAFESGKYEDILNKYPGL
uniref:hypothetical protein n=1 Tax=Gemmiger formicilis TaxID=745368 RepID=UPI003FF050BC